MDIQLPVALLPGFILYAIVISLLLKPGHSISQKSAACLVILLLAISWLTGLFTWQALVALLIAIVGTSQVQSDKSALKFLGWLSLFSSPLLLALHLIPGFTSETIFGPQILGSSDLPYRLNINIDKALGALLIIFCFRYWLKYPFKFELSTRLAVQISLAIIALFTLGYVLGVGFDPKFGQLSIAFIFFNLFITCVAEESFFRLLIQRFLFVNTNNAILAISGSSLLFTLAHFHTGPGAFERLSLIFAAGLLYAWVYQRTGSLLSAVICHFVVNFVHLSLFVYPATFT
jgi:membrane protease YdiL (CAAX protease family)